MGPQFVHIQTFARKPNPAGQSVDQVFGELERRPEFAKHVNSPRPPELIEGMPLPELRAAHDTMIANAATSVRGTGKNTGKTLSRAIRRDRHTLLAAVASYPLTWEQIGDDPEERERLADWERATVRWAWGQWGEHFASGFRHIDEPHPHVHLYALPLGIVGVDATQLHPGKVAKRAAEIQLKAAGVPAKDAITQANAVYRERMREFQDTYYAEVGEPCGLTRTGPQRRRLSRAQWQAEKREARRRSASTLRQDREALDRDQAALAAVTEQIEDGFKLAVSLVADGRLHLAQGSLHVPEEYHDTLLPIWPLISRPVGQLMSLRNRWTGSINRVFDLLDRNEVAADLREEALELVVESAACSFDSP